MLATRSEGVGSPKPHRNRLLHGPEWISPYEVRRAALRRVTRSEPAAFRSSRGVVLVDATPSPDVVDLAARRADRARRAGEAAALHPSSWRPA